MPSGDLLQSLMSGDVVTADEGANLHELAQTMIDQEVGSVIIVDEGQVIGIVTEHDVVWAISEGMDLADTSAFDVMTEYPLCADVEDRVDVIVERMVEAGVLHVPVLGDGRLRGVLSARDLLTRWSREPIGDDGSD
jgi:CBS domain-containing protein